MSIISFVIFATVALATVLFSLLLGLINSRRKSANFDLSYGNQLLAYTIEENHNQNYSPNNRISEYDESDNFLVDYDKRQDFEPINQIADSDSGYSMSKRNFSVAGSRLIVVKPSSKIEPMRNRQIKLQFK